MGRGLGAFCLAAPPWRVRACEALSEPGFGRVPFHWCPLQGRVLRAFRTVRVGGGRALVQERGRVCAVGAHVRRFGWRWGWGLPGARESPGLPVFAWWLRASGCCRSTPHRGGTMGTT